MLNWNLLVRRCEAPDCIQLDWHRVKR